MSGDETGMAYCSRCGHELGEREVGGRVRPACPVCGLVVYEDPKLAVAVLIEQDGRLLLGRRGPNAAAAGRWSFPAGFVDRGERVEDAAVREAREETGLGVRLDRLIGLYSAAGDPVVLAVYAATAFAGAPAPADDLVELAFFPLEDLPEPAFAHDRQIVADWLIWRGNRRG